MSYQDMVAAHEQADYEWDNALQDARQHRDWQTGDPSNARVIVHLRDGLTYNDVPVSIPTALGERMNALAEMVVIFYRHAPGRYWPCCVREQPGRRHAFVLEARLPDGRIRSVEYPPKSGQVALDRVAELVDWAEREMGVTA